MDDLVCDHVLDSLTRGLEILTRVEVIGMLGEILADVGGHGKADIGVDVDLADSKLGSFTELILGNADRIGHVSAVLVDHLDKFLRHGRRAMQDDREEGA